MHSTIGFSHYNLRAPRPLMEELRAFYCEVVGLAVGERPPFQSHGYWLYAGSQAVLHLTEAGPDEVRPRIPEGTFDHAAFSCRDHRYFEKLLASRGIAYDTASVPSTGCLQLFFTDPAGNGVELNFAEPEQ
jgi:catechol-2,3-dioxygenase